VRAHLVDHDGGFRVEGGALLALSAGAVALLLALLVPAAALAGPPGKWTRVTSFAEPVNTNEVGLERTADGVLHVLWPNDTGSSEQILHSAISADAKSVSGPDAVTGGANSVNGSVDLVPGPGGGLRAFFAGLFPSTSFSQVMATATSDASGKTWSAPAPASKTSPGSSPVYAAAGIGAAARGPAIVSAWGDSSPSAGGYHLGIDPSVADIGFSSGADEIDPNVAIDAVSGEIVIGWGFLGPPASVQALRVGQPGILTAPGSGARWLQQRTGLTARIGAPGVFAAYGHGTNPFDARPALWRVGAAKAAVISKSKDAEHTTLSAAPGGRLWVAWEGADRGNKIFATRTNADAKPSGAIVSAKPPAGTQVIYRLAVDGSGGALDVLALADRGGGDLDYWHQRVLPGLTLKAKPKKVKAGKEVTFKVSDAGTPVGKAKVKLKLGKKTLGGKTAADGKLVLGIPKKTKKGTYKAKAKRPGYAPAKRKIKVR
jgi:hypothetical protein